MRYQKPHDYSAAEKIFINVEQDDTQNTFALGDLVMWKLTNDAASYTAGNLPAFATWGIRIEQMATTTDAASLRGAGLVASLPQDMGTGSNLHSTRPATQPFELQVYGPNSNALADGIIAAGAGVEAGAVAGSIRTATTFTEGCQVGFCMDAFTDTNRDGVVFIKGLL